MDRIMAQPWRKCWQAGIPRTELVGVTKCLPSPDLTPFYSGVTVGSNTYIFQPLIVTWNQGTSSQPCKVRGSVQSTSGSRCLCEA